ncbi:hemerythrin [bacterium endosymbiont of Escarpia laminata]|nr:MAG: hemerythrin [bacterium endosymbiont of Escarpia laminata]
MSMEWQKKFEVGHYKIDLEHRVFFELVKSIAAAEAHGASRDKIRRLIAETAKYAEFHFLSEENIMIDVGYPEFEEHREHHQSLMRNMQKYVVSFESGDSNIHDLVGFLLDWFVKHTTTEDLLLSKYIKQA